ncbi:MAG TPA: DUF1579 domain-containing protein [Pirellulaceae bacterium]|nr:DUF1579 domain-containing protein [Pirellulaceae bacterium]
MSKEANPVDSTPSMPVAGPEHFRLQPFVGKFRAEVKIWMGPGDPIISTGTMVNTMEVNGLFLQQDYIGDSQEGPFPSFLGKGFWGYNTVQKQYEGFWIDNASTIMQFEAGQVSADGKVWEMIGAIPCGSDGQINRKRSVIKLIDDDQHMMEMFFTDPSGQETKNMEIQYVRVA